LTLQTRRLLVELIRRDRLRIATRSGNVPVRLAEIVREDAKPTIVVSSGVI
jgi:hypothetical protein